MRCSELDELREILTGTYGPHEIQIEGPARLDAVVNGTSLEDVFFVYNCFGGRDLRARVDTKHAPPVDAVFLNLPRTGGGDLHYDGRRHSFHRETGLCVDARRPFVGHYFGYATLNLVIPVPALAATARALVGGDCPTTLELESAVDLSSPDGRALVRLATSLAMTLDEGGDGLRTPLVARAARSHLLATVLATVSSNVREAVRGAGRVAQVLPRHVKRARDFIHAHAREPLDLGAICVAAGCSARALQDGFRRSFQSSPMQYLEATRLEGAHAEILQEDLPGTVGEIARRWGFVHRGRFAQAYARRFGCTPVETLRRVGRRR
jgi:AraC-like DNA-binding protein